jgi:hypothetical protein
MLSIERNPHSEKGIYYREIRDLLQKAAREQDILDGGTGETIYKFTIRDAVTFAWEEGSPPKKNIRHFIK